MLKGSSIYIFLAMYFTAYGENVNNHASWAYIPKDCGQTRFNVTSTRIINGNEARLGEFPWMGRLGKIKKNGKPFFFCGASLISKYYALSAAHCEQRPDILRLGENYANVSIDCDKFGECAPPHQDIRIKSVLTDDFCRIGLLRDLIVLELEKPVNFNEFVQPICLPRGPLAEADLTNDSLIISGWGETELPQIGLASNYLLHITLPVLDFKECKKIFHYMLDDEQLCVKASNEGQNACLGDSGGPAFKSVEVNGIRRNYIFGVFSYIETGCKSGSVFIRVPHFLGSILDKITKG